MAKKEGEWAFPVEMRPRPEEWRFDLDSALDSVVGLRAEIPEAGRPHHPRTHVRNEARGSPCLNSHAR